jgi:hypothetical protein
MTRVSRWFFVAASALALVSCSRASAPTQSPAPAAFSSSVASAAPTATATGSENPAASTVPPAAVPSQQTFDVIWNPQTKIIDPATVRSAYRGVGSDGSITFDAAQAPTIAALVPGTITVFSGLALRKIVSVRNDGNQLHVATAPVALDQAITKGHIAWQYNASFGGLSYAQPSGLHLVDDPGQWLAQLFAEPALADNALHYGGDIKDWDIDLTLAPRLNDLTIEFKATKEEGGGSIEVTGSGELDNFTNSVDMTIDGGSTRRIQFNNDGLQGKLDLKWTVAFDKEHGGEEVGKFNEPAVIKLPLSLTLPILAGPIPFELKINTGFAFSPFFSSKTTVAQGEYHTSFGGDVSMIDTPDGVETGPADQLKGDGQITTYGGTLSVAPLGLSLTFMAPKIELSVGAPEELETILGETSAGAWVALFVQANFVATGPVSIAACERRELVLTGTTGYEAGLLGIGLVSHKTEVFRKSYQIIEPPNITLCKS